MSIKTHKTKSGYKVCSAKPGNCPYGDDNSHLEFEDKEEFNDWQQKRNRETIGLLPGASDSSVKKEKYLELTESAETYLENENSVILQDGGTSYIVDKSDYTIEEYDLSDRNLMTRYADVIKTGKKNSFPEEYWREHMENELDGYGVDESQWTNHDNLYDRDEITKERRAEIDEINAAYAYKEPEKSPAEKKEADRLLKEEEQAYARMAKNLKKEEY